MSDGWIDGPTVVLLAEGDLDRVMEVIGWTGAAIGIGRLPLRYRLLDEGRVEVQSGALIPSIAAALDRGEMVPPDETHEVRTPPPGWFLEHLFTARMEAMRDGA